jgi:hypothetical protein
MQGGFISQNNEKMIHYSSTIKGNLFIFFFFLSLFLSFTHFTMIHKKRTCLLSARIGIDGSNYGKTDTFDKYIFKNNIMNAL